MVTKPPTKHPYKKSKKGMIIILAIVSIMLIITIYALHNARVFDLGFLGIPRLNFITEDEEILDAKIPNMKRTEVRRAYLKNFFLFIEDEDGSQHKIPAHLVGPTYVIEEEKIKGVHLEDGHYKLDSMQQYHITELEAGDIIIDQTIEKVKMPDEEEGIFRIVFFVQRGNEDVADDVIEIKVESEEVAIENVEEVEETEIEPTPTTSTYSPPKTILKKDSGVIWEERDPNGNKRNK